MSYPPTAEQQRAIDLSLEGIDLKIEAAAGSGKTSTLVEIGKAKSTQRGLYICFNRANADEAKTRFPSHVQCRTAHSLAFGPVGTKYKSRLKGRLVPRLIIEEFQLLPC